MKIYVKNNDISKALRVLKKKLLIEGDAKNLRDKQHFTSKSEKRRLEERAGARRWVKKRTKFLDNVEKNEQLLINKNRKAARQQNRNK